MAEKNTICTLEITGFTAEGLEVTVTQVEHRRALEIQVRVVEEES